MSWLHAHFSPDFAVHGIFDFDPSGGPDAPTKLALQHGYVLDRGEVCGLSAGEGTAYRQGFYARAVDLALTDAAGRAWMLHGDALTSFPWQAGPGTVGFNVLAQWQCGERQGYGEIQDFIGPRQLCALYSRR